MNFNDTTITATNNIWSKLQWSRVSVPLILVGISIYIYIHTHIILFIYNNTLFCGSVLRANKNMRFRDKRMQSVLY